MVLLLPLRYNIKLMPFLSMLAVFRSRFLDFYKEQLTVHTVQSNIYKQATLLLLIQITSHKESEGSQH